MGFFDNLKQVANSVEKAIPKDSNFYGLSGATKVSVNIGAMPASVEEFKTKDGADFKDENKVIALTILALCAYPVNKEMSIEMLNYLKGPTPLSAYDNNFFPTDLVVKIILHYHFCKVHPLKITIHKPNHTLLMYIKPLIVKI